MRAHPMPVLVVLLVAVGASCLSHVTAQYSKAQTQTQPRSLSRRSTRRGSGIVDIPPCRTTSGLSTCSWIDYDAWVPWPNVALAGEYTELKENKLTCDPHSGLCTSFASSKRFAGDAVLLDLALGNSTEVVFADLLSRNSDDEENITACKWRYVAWACASRFPECNQNQDGPLPTCERTCQDMLDWCVSNGVLSAEDRLKLPYFSADLNSFMCSALPETECTAASDRLRPMWLFALLLWAVCYITRTR